MGLKPVYIHFFEFVYVINRSHVLLANDKLGEDINKHIASVLILLIVLINVYFVCLSIEMNMFKLN